MTKKLREIAESKGREFWVSPAFYSADNRQITDDIILLKPLGEPFDSNYTHVIEKSDYDKLAAALKVACSVIDLQREALGSIEKNQCYDCACGNTAEDALAAAEKTMGEL